MLSVFRDGLKNCCHMLGGKLMIKVVLQSLPTYTMSCFLPLKNLCGEIVSLIS